MKKIIYIMLIIIVLSFYVNNSNSSLIIPDNSIRFRIIANSNEAKDQALKMDIKIFFKTIVSVFKRDGAV